MKRSATPVLSLITLYIAGCGSAVVPSYPNRLTGPEGQLIVFEDIQAITSDTDLTDDEKRDQLRGLGLEDERLLDALLLR